MRKARAGVIYTGRLGDIVGTLPLSKTLHDQGFDVFHYCCECFADVFGAVSYVKARPVSGDVVEAYERAKDAACSDQCDIIVDHQIYPRLIHDYRGSGKTWQQYYYQFFPELIDATPQFNVHYLDTVKLKPKTLLLSMHGVSSPMNVDWFWVARVIELLRERGAIEHVVYFCGPGQTCPLNCEVNDSTPPSRMPSVMKQARLILTRNSAPAWFARGTGVPTLHIPDSCYPLTDSAGPAPNMVRIEHGNFNDIPPAVEKVLSCAY